MMIPGLGAPTVGADSRIEVPIDDLAGNDLVRLDYAISATLPASGSHLWISIGTVGSPGSVYTTPLWPGATAWIRASGRTAAGNQSSAYTPAVDVDVADWPRFASTSFALAGRVPSISWDPAPLTLGVRLSWAVHEQLTDPGSLLDSVDADSSAGEIVLPVALEDGQAITLRLEAWSGWDPPSVAGTLGQVLAGKLVQAAPDVEAHGHTHKAGGSGELDMGNLVITAANGSRWHLAIGDDGTLTTAPYPLSYRDAAWPADSIAVSDRHSDEEMATGSDLAAVSDGHSAQESATGMDSYNWSDDT